MFKGKISVTAISCYNRTNIPLTTEKENTVRRSVTIKNNRPRPDREFHCPLTNHSSTCKDKDETRTLEFCYHIMVFSSSDGQPLYTKLPKVLSPPPFTLWHHTYIHTYIHIHIHTHTFTYTYTHIHSYKTTQGVGSVRKGICQSPEKLVEYQWEILRPRCVCSKPSWWNGLCPFLPRNGCNRAFRITSFESTKGHRANAEV